MTRVARTNSFERPAHSLVEMQFIGTWFIRRATLRRLQSMDCSTRSRDQHLRIRESLRVRSHSRNKRSFGASHLEGIADFLDGVGRELRLGSSLHKSLLTSIGRHPGCGLGWLAEVAREGRALDEAIRQHLGMLDADGAKRGTTVETYGSRLALRTLMVAAQGGDSVHAVESAARALRTTAAVEADARNAVAHTASSINVLTVLPGVITVWLLFASVDAREFLLSSGGVVCAAFGAGFNILGRLTVRRMVRGSVRFDDELPDFLDVVTVNMRSGMPPAAAFLRAGETTHGEVASAVRAVAESTNAGSRFAEALADQRMRFPPRGQPLIDAIIDTERDGLPARDLFRRLSDDAHAMRRRESERKIRALPVRLTLPLVGLVLPSYVLLAVVPLLASQLTSVVIDPPN